jgi:hypothetical protein
VQIYHSSNILNIKDYLCGKDLNFHKLNANMNIGIVINTSWNIFNFRMGLANALIKEGHQVFAIAPEDRYSSRLEASGIKFIPVKLGSKSHNPFKDIKLVFDLTKIYRQNQLDFVLHFTIKPNIYGSIATFFCNAKAINNVSGLGKIW